MRQRISRSFAFMFVGACLGCAPDTPELPVGPCNSDGGTEAGESGPLVDKSPSPVSLPSLRPQPPASSGPVRGWSYDPDTETHYRTASEAEREAHRWPDTSILIAIPDLQFQDIIQPVADRVVMQVAPPVIEARGEQLLFEFTESFDLGEFVEHRGGREGLLHRTSRPTFRRYELVPPTTKVTGQLLTSSEGAVLLTLSTARRTLTVRGPQEPAGLTPAPPAGYRVLRVESGDKEPPPGPTSPFNCENGVCDPPTRVVDECNDGVDNDGDGHADLCDWNCLPHDDFGAGQFPEARSRTEAGKIYALMGHGSFCTLYPETWELEFAQTALQTEGALNSLRPDLPNPIRFRTFSCWVFEDYDAYRLCQFGPYEVVDGEVNYLPPICPPGFDYPYTPTELDQLSDLDQANLLYEEAAAAAWIDFEYNSVILGDRAEPRNGVMLITSEPRSLCAVEDYPICPPAAGRATYPWGAVQSRGTGVILDEPELTSMWISLAHEVGHTIGLVHDDVPGGFMNKFGGTNIELGVSVDAEHPGVVNKAQWELGLQGSKGENPRSPGFYLTGCESLAQCAPLGKPGWSCTGLFCVEDSP